MHRVLAIAALLQITGCVQELDPGQFKLDCAGPLADTCPAPLVCGPDDLCAPAADSPSPTPEGGEGEAAEEPDGEEVPPVVGEGEGEGEGEPLPAGEGEGEREGPPTTECGGREGTVSCSGEGESEDEPLPAGEGEGEGEPACLPLQRPLDGRCVDVPALLRATDTPGGPGHAGSPAFAHTTSLVQISGDGRHVAFVSSSTAFGEGHVDSLVDVFVRDLLTDRILRVSEPTGGGDATDHAQFVSVSGDGRHVAWASGATNLVAADDNRQIDVFVRDMETGLITLASVNGAGAQASASCDRPRIAQDGRHVVFDTRGVELGSDGHLDVIVRDLSEPGALETASLSSAGAHAGARQGQNAFRGVPSANGRSVVFYSLGRGLVPELDGQLAAEGPYVYVRQLDGPRTVMVSLDNQGAPMLGSYASISGDGGTVAWRSDAHIAPGNEGNTSQDVFVRDVDGEGGTTLVSATAAGLESSGEVGGVGLSEDGRYVVFVAAADDLVEGDSNQTWDAFLHDREQDTLVRVSEDMQGRGGLLPTMGVSISADGSTVAFITQSALLPGGDPDHPAIYVRRYR